MSFNEKQIEELAKPLDRARVKSRKQGGGQVSYIESWHAEAEANRIFGFGEWDSTIKEIRKVSEREVIIGKGGQYEKPGWSVSYLAVVTVTVYSGDGSATVREGAGAGHGIDADLGQAHESAVKEATSDAEKRALKTFGNQFGLALYDKTQANVADVPAPEHPALAEGKMAAERGTAALGAWWTRLSKPDQAKLAHAKDDVLKPMAAIADAAAKAEPFPGDKAA